MSCKLGNLLCIMALIWLLAAIPPQVKAASIDIRVCQSTDDAEENSNNGAMYLNSLDLEMVHDYDRVPECDQTIGVRFQNITIPQGATINSAYLEFVTEETSSEDTSLSIYGEDIDKALTFSTANSNISNRIKTAASVSWADLLPWASVNGIHRTPDLTSIVQEIVNRVGWTSNNAMAFIITGSGLRQAKSWDLESGRSPLLHIDYTSHSLDIRVCQGSDDAEEKGWGTVMLDNTDLEIVKYSSRTTGLRFQNITIPQGAVINSCYIVFETDETTTSKTKLTIRGEDTDNAPTFTSSISNLSNRTKTDAAVAWKVRKWKTVNEKHQTPDLSSVAQETIGRGGWQSGNAIVFLITGSGLRIAESYEGAVGHGDIDKAPLLHIEYQPNNIPYITLDKSILGAVCYEGSNAPSDNFTITDTGLDDLAFTISDNADWVSVSPTSSTLIPGAAASITVTYSSASLALGTHEAIITITGTNAPNSPREIQVSLTVESPPESTACGHIPLYTENLVSPAILVLMDVSGSMDTLMPICEPESNPKTPDISSILREIVDRGIWQTGNAMSFIITGNGHRKAKSFDRDTAYAPLLQVEYGTNEVLEIRVSHSRDDAEEESGGNMRRTGNILDLGYWDVGLRFQNITIPQAEIITNAYIEFVPDATNSESTSLTIWGQDIDNAPRFQTSDYDISNRTKTTTSVSWNNVQEWEAQTEESRLEIAKSVLSELVKDKSISWGFGTWTKKWYTSYTESNDYTLVHIGCKFHDETHQANLQTEIAAAKTYGWTPYVYSIDAARKYFLGQKRDNNGTGDYYCGADCQPKFLICVTDGLGNVPEDTTPDLVAQYINSLCDASVSPIMVGFGIDDAIQIQKAAEVSNIRGHASSELYALHEEVGEVGQSFLAYNKSALKEALATITERIKAQIFHGSAPAPTTSTDYGDLLIVAQFDATDWTGDLMALTYNESSGEWDTIVWRASDNIPDTRKVFTIDPSNSNSVITYTDSVLPNDNHLCKDLGDIINSIPIIVESPPFYYTFDGYESWKRTISRDPIIYIGANDGALHAFSLTDGVEKWAFVPLSSHSKLDSADDPTYDMCSEGYCHQYFVDGSPKAGDIYTGSEWMTILVCGLREGGESYFALDITHGIPFLETDGAAYLWEYTDAELGQTSTDPGIERVSDGSGTDWGVFFGSGYSPTDQDNKEAYLYGLVAYNQDPLWKDANNIDTDKIKISASTLKNDALSSPLIADLDADYVGERIYVGNLYGTLYRVSDIGKGGNPAISELFDFGHTSHINPIKGKPNYAYTTTSNTIRVYFGTGRYESQADKTTTTQQYLFGLKDSISSPHTYALGELVSLTAELKEYTDPETGDTQPIKVITGANSYKEPWLVELDNSSSGLVGSERSLEQPLVVAGVVFFTTFVPDSDICTGSGDTFIYALDCETGLPPDTPVFDLNDDGHFNGDDKVEGEEVAAIKIGTGQGSGPVIHKDTLFVTTTDNDNVTALKVNLPNLKAKVISWKDKTL